MLYAKAITMSASTTSSPRALRRFLKWLLLAGIGVLVLIGLLLLMAPMMVNSMVRPKVVAALNEQLNGEAGLEGLHYSWSDGLTIEGLSISNPEGFAKGVAASVGRVRANPSLISLLSGKLIFNEDLRVESIHLNVEQNAKGDLNLAKLIKEQPVKRHDEPKTAIARPAPANTSLPSVQGGLVVKDIILSLKTPALATPVALSPLHIESRITGLDKPFTFAVTNNDASLSAKGSIQLAARVTTILEYAIKPEFLAPLTPALATFGPVKKFDGTLSGKGHLTLSDPKSTSGQGDLTLAISALELETPNDKGAPTLRRLQPGDTKLTYEFKPADGTASFTANLAAPATTLSLKGLTDGAAFDGALSLVTDLAELGRRLPGIIPEESKLQGRISLNAPHIKADAKAATAEVNLRAEGLSSGGATPIKEFESQLSLNADLQKQTYGMQTTLDLTKLREIAITMGALPPSTELSGNAKLAADVALSGATFPYHASLEATKFHFKGPQTNGVPIDEPEPVIQLAGILSTGGSGPSINFNEGSTVAMQLMRGTVKGSMTQTTEHGLVADNVLVDVTYYPPKFNPLLAAFKAGQIVATGPQQAQIKLNGPLQPGEDMPQWLRVVKTASSLGFTAYRNTGVTIEGAPFSANLTDGQLPIDYACKINSGPFSAKGNVRLVGPASDLSVKLEGMGINYEMASFLGFLNPLMGGSKSNTPVLSGQVNAQFSGRWNGALVEKPDPKAAPPDYLALASSRLSGKGRFSVANFKSSGSPLIMLLNNVIGGTGEKIGEIQPTDFSIENGALRYDSMVVMLAGQKIVFSGVIYFSQSMDMQITMPFPSKLIKDQRLAKYLTTITVPLTGTISEPKLDTQAVIQLALKNATNAALKDGIGGALEKKMGGAAGSVLKGLFGGKK
jgi:hypothetical protein